MGTSHGYGYWDIQRFNSCLSLFHHRNFSIIWFAFYSFGRFLPALQGRWAWAKHWGSNNFSVRTKAGRLQNVIGKKNDAYHCWILMNLSLSELSKFVYLNIQSVMFTVAKICVRWTAKFCVNWFFSFCPRRFSVNLIGSWMNLRYRISFWCLYSSIS